MTRLAFPKTETGKTGRASYDPNISSNFISTSGPSFKLIAQNGTCSKPIYFLQDCPYSAAHKKSITKKVNN
jgi:hypothetical protein